VPPDDGKGNEVAEEAEPAVPALSREELLHLAADWDAQAAEIERTMEDQAPGQRAVRTTRALVSREHAGQLRARIAGRMHVISGIDCDVDYEGRVNGAGEQETEEHHE
jgi:hypothetical protein